MGLVFLFVSMLRFKSYILTYILFISGLCGYMLRAKKAYKYSFDLDDSPTEQVNQWQKKLVKLKEKGATALENFRAKERQRLKNLRSTATEDQKQRNR